MKKPKLLSFFSGCGGLDLGFEAAGFEISLAVELEEYACDTYRKNFPKTKAMGPPDHHGDVSKLNGKEVLGFAGLKRNEIDIVVGGPPCQPFSVAATQRFSKTNEKFKRKGFRDTKRGALLVDFIKIILEINPKVFLIENVPGISTIDSGRQISRIKRMVEGKGYHLSGPHIVNVADYGVPQNRRRAIMIGSREIKNFDLPPPMRGLDSPLAAPYATVAQALFGVSNKLSNHQTRSHDRKTLARYVQLKFGEREPLGRVDRLDPFKPSKTIIAGGSNGGGRSHLHPFVARTLSVRESARLQTFNDSFIFTGSIARQFTQVGNAVPPLFAEILARHIADKEFGIKIKGPFKNGKELKTRLSLEKAASLLREQAEKESRFLYHDVQRKKLPARFQRSRELVLSY